MAQPQQMDDVDNLEERPGPNMYCYMQFSTGSRNTPQSYAYDMTYPHPLPRMSPPEQLDHNNYDRTHPPPPYQDIANNPHIARSNEYTATSSVTENPGRMSLADLIRVIASQRMAEEDQRARDRGQDAVNAAEAQSDTTSIAEDVQENIENGVVRPSTVRRENEDEDQACHCQTCGCGEHTRDHRTEPVLIQGLENYHQAAQSPVDGRLAYSLQSEDHHGGERLPGHDVRGQVFDSPRHHFAENTQLGRGDSHQARHSAVDRWIQNALQSEDHNEAEQVPRDIVRSYTYSFLRQGVATAETSLIVPYTATYNNASYTLERVEMNAFYTRVAPFNDGQPREETTAGIME